jgi:hypothetical protein
MDKKVLFLHVPKTAGSSIHATYRRIIDVRLHNISGCAEDYIELNGLDGYFKFGFKRNPYSRFRSLYQYFATMESSHMFFKYNEKISRVVARYKSLDAFATDFPELNVRSNFHFKTQADYLCTRSGDALVDFMGSVENIKTDNLRLAKILGLQDTLASSALVESNKSSMSSEFDIAVTPTVIEVVNHIYRRDFTDLGYEMNML